MEVGGQKSQGGKTHLADGISFSQSYDPCTWQNHLQGGKTYCLTVSEISIVVALAGEGREGRR